MKVAVLSGKGGTGKTTVATNLAYVMKAHYMDCDVEEPNGHLFLKPMIKAKIDATIENPKIMNTKCSQCGLCASTCRFNALAVTALGVQVFNELCHGCGACSLVCPNEAIEEYSRVVGKIQIGQMGEAMFLEGRLNIKEPMGVPVISKLNTLLPAEGITLVDCSPGTSCSVVSALDDVDYAVLVTEPTRFGVHDLELALELLKALKIPHGVIVNRSNDEDKRIQDICEAWKTPLMGRIPFRRDAAIAYSKGELLAKEEPFKTYFKGIADALMDSIEKETR